MVVRRVPFILWSVVVLLVVRLVLGEFAHALPHHTGEEASVADLAAADSAATVDCPDHANSKQDEEHPAETKSDSHTIDESSSKQHGAECCETTCDCACVHITPVAGFLPSTTLGMLDSTNIAGPSVRPSRPVLSGIFRPPA